MIIVKMTAGLLHGEMPEQQPAFTIAPITSRIEKNTGQPTHVNIGRIGHNHVLSVVQLEQIRTIDKQRVIRYFGIGQEKIRSLVQMHENDDYILRVRVKVLIKRK